MADAAFSAFTDEIAGARAALVELVHPDEEWHPYDLKTRVRNGWSAGAVSLALSQLLEDGAFEEEAGYIRLRR